MSTTPPISSTPRVISTSPHTDDLVIIQITANDTRTVEQKQAFFARVATLLAEDPGLRKEDVFINLVECKKENWSFGNGIAQYV